MQGSQDVLSTQGDRSYVVGAIVSNTVVELLGFERGSEGGGDVFVTSQYDLQLRKDSDGLNLFLSFLESTPKELGFWGPAVSEVFYTNRR